MHSSRSLYRSMSTSLLYRSIAFLRVFFLLSVIKEGSIDGKSMYTAVSVTLPNCGRQNQNMASKKNTVTITSRTFSDTNYQRNSSYPILFHSSQVHLRQLHDQTKLAFTNTVRLQLHASSKAFGYMRDRTSAIASSPSFPHFIAGIAAGAL